MIEKRFIPRIPVADLVPCEDNPRNHGRLSIDDIKQSILQCGDGEPLDPIEIDENNVILCGHGRRLAMLELGITETSAVQYIGMTEKQKRKYRVLANKTQERSTWDLALLAKQLDGLDFDGYDFGFDDLVDRDEEPPPAEEDTFDPEPPQDPISRPGDLWTLGDHRLLVGDSTKAEDIRRLMDGKLADLWLTDPPYNVDYKAKAGSIQGDNQEDAQFREFLRAANRAAHENMRPGAAFYIWHADSEGLNFRAACNETGLRVRECLIWVKNSFVLGHSDYQWQHEPCLYGWKDGAAHYFTDSRSESTVIPDLTEIDPRKMKKDELVTLVQKILGDQTPSTVIKMDKPSRNGEHPTMKPVGLFDYLIRNSSRKGDTVLDSFAGSGTTIMACEQNGRFARCMEIDPRYADVIIRRWESFTGEKAVRQDG